MKSLIKGLTTVIVIFLFCSSSSLAQKSGVFRSYADYTTGKMEYDIDCETEKHKIKLNDFLGMNYITVIHEGKPYRLKKTQIWGYQLCDSSVIRFQGKEHFRLQDKDVLWIYSQQKTLTDNPKTGNTKILTSYYFSVGGNSKIRDLILLNLKSAFPDNHVLHDAIEAQFKSDASLNEYDEFHKHYKINHFLETRGIN